jgi:TIR domain
MATQPKAFISHASDDKHRFVIDFATRLRAAGIDAWLDRWEMNAGDSLVERIFEEGIREADLFIVVLSEKSVNKRWVREELDVGVVQRINGHSRLIPVILDAVAIPTSVVHLLHLSVEQLGVEGVVSEIVRVAYSESDRPPLGEQPAYIKAQPNRRLLTDPVDDLVYQLILDALRDHGSNYILFSNDIQEAARTQGIPDDAFFESMHSLSQQRLVDAEPMAGNLRWWIRGVPERAWLDEAAQSGVDIQSAKRRLLAHIVNSEATLRTLNLHGFDGLTDRVIRALLVELDAEDLLTCHLDVNGEAIIQSVGPLARRLLR